MTTSTNDIFNSEFSRRYDACNGRLGKISENLHFLISLLLNDMPDNAQVLCIGVGTGSEIVQLAQANPGWRFTGVDPSADMLAVCAEKLQQHGLSDRCTLVHGYTQDVAESASFDVVLSLLVTHFIPLAEREALLRQITSRLKRGGKMVMAEIAADTASAEFDRQLVSWAAMHQHASQQPQNISELKTQLSQRLHLLPPARTEALISAAGFQTPYRFFQSLLIHGWVAVN